MVDTTLLASTDIDGVSFTKYADLTAFDAATTAARPAAGQDFLVHIGGVIQRLDSAGALHTVTPGFDGRTPQGYIAGFEVNVSAVGDDAVIDPGICRNDSDVYTMVKTTSLTVDLSAAVGALGLDAGSKSNSTWYYIWIIAKSADGTTSAIASLSASAPTLPSGYDRKRLVGAVKTDASGNLFRQRVRSGGGNERFVQYQEAVNAAPFRILSGANLANNTWTDVNCSPVAPSISRSVSLYFLLNTPSSVVALGWREKGITSQMMELVESGSAENNGYVHSSLPVDSTQIGQIWDQAITSTEDLYIDLHGYWMNLLPAITGGSGDDV